MPPIIVVVALIGWSEGFVVNRLTDLLRGRGYSFADAFRLASQVSEGTQVALSFDSIHEADRFAREARSIGARPEIRVPAAAG